MDFDDLPAEHRPTTAAMVYLVVDGHRQGGGPVKGYTDRARAYEFAANTGGLVVESMAFDLRPQGRERGVIE